MAIDPLSELNQLTGEVAAIGSHMFRIRLPFIGELRNYSLAKLRSDAIAGATLTLVSIPQAIGFSLILNLPPAPVIAAVIIGGFVGALFFSSRHHVFGPTSSISLIVAATIAAHTNATGLAPLQLAVYLAFLIGLIQLLAGLLNFGEITKFISRSVVIGYSTGIGVLLIASQLHNVLGFSADPSQRFVTDVWQAFSSIATVHVEVWAIGIGALTLTIFFLVKRWRPNWPEALIGLATLAIAARIFTAFVPERRRQHERSAHGRRRGRAGYRREHVHGERETGEHNGGERVRGRLATGGTRVGPDRGDGQRQRLADAGAFQRRPSVHTPCPRSARPHGLSHEENGARARLGAGHN